MVTLVLSDPRIRPLFDPRSGEYEVLVVASSAGQVAVIEQLLAHPRLRNTGWFPRALSAAAAHGHVDVVQRLMHATTPRSRVADYEVGHMMSRAAEWGHVSMVACLTRYVSMAYWLVVPLYFFESVGAWARRRVARWL